METDLGVKYLKWSKLRELVAKILINCFKAVKFTEILTQQSSRLGAGILLEYLLGESH